jgi:hypothetical protein
VIPVILKPEPPDFDQKVRQPGYIWLAGKGIDSNGAPPKGTKLKDLWRKSYGQLYDAYGGVCAYLAIYFEHCIGAGSTDHFIPKSIHAGKAYEWGNYRLSCRDANALKNKYDVLDPIGLRPDTFVLNLVDGEISPSPALNTAEKSAAEKTIAQLKLDSPRHRCMRARHFARYLRNKDDQFLREESPFVWYEANRQRLL